VCANSSRVASISNGRTTVEFVDGHVASISRAGEAKRMFDLRAAAYGGIAIHLKANFHCSASDVDDLCPPPNEQSSGAYIFRPKGGAVELEGDGGGFVGFNSGAFSEACARYGGGAQGDEVGVCVALRDGSDDLFVKTSTKVTARSGEVVLKWRGGGENTTLVTDNSAAAYVERSRRFDTAEFAASNYFPLQGGGGLLDLEGGGFLGVVADHSHGAASLDGGEMEVLSFPPF
jgi:hypothetical protein